MRLSYSRAKAFEECPARFKAEYIDGNKPPAESYLVVGSMVHEMLDRYVKHLVETRQSTDFAQLKAIRDAVLAESREAVPASCLPDVDELLLRAQDIVAFADPSTVVQSEMSVAVDQEGHVCAWDDPKAFLRGKIDLMTREDGKLVISDYKTGNRIESAETSLQLKTYFALASVAMDEHPAVGRLLYLRHGTSRTVKFKDGDAIVDEVAKHYCETARSIERCMAMDRWPARPGQACRGCGNFTCCPARQRLGRVLPPQDMQEAEKLMERLILLEQERESTRDMLGVWVDQYGDLEVNGAVLGYRAEKRLDFDTPKVWSLLENRGFRPLDLMRVDTTSLKKLARKDRKLQADIEACSTPASITKLKLSLSKEDA